MQNCKTNINNDLGRIKEEKQAPIKQLCVSSESVVEKVARTENGVQFDNVERKVTDLKRE
jgi:hypothetical protein